MIRDISGQDCINEGFTDRPVLSFAHIIKNITLWVMQNFKRYSEMVLLQYRPIIVPDCLFMFRYNQELSIESRMSQVMQ